MQQIFGKSYQEDDEYDQKCDGADGEISPKQFEVTCGTDKISHAHIGNKRFRDIIEMIRERYQTAPSRDEKMRITCEIVSVVRSHRPGGRFLKINTDTKKWNDVGDEYAREKVSHALRYRKKRKAAPTSHTDQESDVFATLLEDQQRILRRLVDEKYHPRLNLSSMTQR
jgi:hypothetical protein